MKPYYSKNGIVIYHGDCREILPTLPKVDLVLTDPPYGIGINYGEYKDCPKEYWKWFAPILKMMCAKPLVFTHRQEALKFVKGWDHLCIWQKPMAFGYAINGWLHHWEPIFVYGARTSSIGKSKKCARFDVFSVGTAVNNTGHPCPKPIKLMYQLVQTFQGTTICDPFMGSGTTLCAAKFAGRYAIGIEIEEKYCEIAAKRLSQRSLFD